MRTSNQIKNTHYFKVNVKNKISRGLRVMSLVC